MTPLSSHRVSGLQAFEKPSERPGDDDGKSGDDGEKSYSQGQETRHMVSPLQNGRRCCNVCLRRKNLCATLQMTRASHRKRSGVLFVLLVAAKRQMLEQIYQVAGTSHCTGNNRTSTIVSLLSTSAVRLASIDELPMHLLDLCCCERLWLWQCLVMLVR